MGIKKELQKQKDEAEKKALQYRAVLVKINDLVDEYKKDGKNIYTTMRDITNTIKGWD